ncbi:MAG: hypothetical protein U0183_13280 [Polyangiaceae bacterium]
MARLTIRRLPSGQVYPTTPRTVKAWLRELPLETRAQFGESTGSLPGDALGSYASDLHFFVAPPADAIVLASLWRSRAPSSSSYFRLHAVAAPLWSEELSERFATWFGEIVLRFCSGSVAPHERHRMAVALLDHGRLSLQELRSRGRER